jgi:hypothetical protein
MSTQTWAKQQIPLKFWKQDIYLNLEVHKEMNTIFVYFYFCTEGTMWHLQKFLQYIIAEFTSPIILLYSLSLFAGIVSIGLIFSIYIDVHIIFTPYSPSHTLSLYPPSTGTNPSQY